MFKLSADRIETERLILRPPVIADAPRIAELANHYEIASRLGSMPHPYSLADAREFLEAATRRPPGTASFAITLNGQGGVLIGMTGYGPAPGATGEDALQMDFGYWLGLDYWGKGYATEAARAALAHAFLVSRQDEIITDFQKSNPVSGRVLEKCGFELIGERTRNSRGGAGRFPTWNVRLTRDRWLAINPELAGTAIP